MKKITFTLIVLVATLCVMSQTKFWVCTDDGKIVEFEIAHTDSISFTEPSTPPDRVKDVCGNTYPTVKIGTQTWMAENLRCDRYDTKAEAYNAGWLKDNTITNSQSEVYTPYYTDASDKSKWNSTNKKYGVNLTDAQIKKFGFFYNWQAAVGSNTAVFDTTAFSGNRQGICPNGWHVPTRAEWQMLVDYIEKTDGMGTGTVGKHLRTTSGWYSGDSDYIQGLDTYGFAALPAGCVALGAVQSVGIGAYFWTASPHKSYNHNAYSRHFYSYYDYDGDDCHNNEREGQSVRCLKD